jgi:DNA invertase Pin-like site-specific DNA recombinase
MPTPIGYARVSTHEQNLDLQTSALTAAGCVRVFTDKASGAQRHRPQLVAALDYLRPGDVLTVWKLDRLGRSLGHLVEITDDLRDRGIEFRSLTEGIDTTTPGGKLVFHIMGAIAEFERDLIRERTNAGLAAARAEGRVGGRPPKVTAAKLAAARRVLDDGGTAYEAAAVIGVSRATLYRHLGPVTS